MASDYPGRTVLVEFFVEKQKRAPRPSEQFSNDLFKAFDKRIVAACADAIPPIDPTARIQASIAVMARHATGANNKIKAERAVQACLEFRGLLNLAS